MRIKNLKLLSRLGLGLTLFFSLLIGNPAKATSMQGRESQSASEFQNQSLDNLISQLRGHDRYEGGEQMEWDGYLVGRVIGRSGSIMFVRLEDGTYFNGVGDGYPGCDVLVEQVDGRYSIVSMAHPAWILILQSKYGWRRVSDVGNLNERTAAIWKELEASSGVVGVSAPPATTAPPTYTEPTPTYTEPVRGLW